MDSDPLDWTLVQSFLAVADHGSLSAAAQRLGHSQPTLGRHIKALEQQVDAPLFHRHARGLHLTETGHQLYPHAAAMREAMGAFALTAAGHARSVGGTVRITTSVFAAHHLLPPILADIRRVAPDISLVLIPSDSSENLLFRDADIAVRMYRSAQLEIVTKHVDDIALGIFAARSYLDRAGRPRSVAELLSHDFIDYDENDLIRRTMTTMGFDPDTMRFPVRCDNQTAYWELVRAGCGIGFSQKMVGQTDPLIEEIDAGLDLPRLPVWLAAHQALRHNPRIRRVWDLLEKGLRARPM